MKGILICVLASGLLIVIFALLIGAVVAGMMDFFPKKEKSRKDGLIKSDTKVDEEIEEAWEIFKTHKIDEDLFDECDIVTDPAYNLLSVNLFHKPEIEIHYADDDK